MTVLDTLQQKIKEGTVCLSHNQTYLTAVHEAGHAVSYWAISDKIVKKKQRYWQRYIRKSVGKVIPPPLPDLPPKFRVVLRSQDEVEAGPYHHHSGEIDCDGIVDMEDMELHTKLVELTPGERVKFYAVSLMTGPIAEMYAVSFLEDLQDDWLVAAGNYERETQNAWEIVRRQYSGKRIGKGQMEKLTGEAHDLVGNHWTAIEALAVELVEKRVIESEEAIAIFEDAECSSS